MVIAINFGSRNLKSGRKYRTHNEMNTFAKPNWKLAFCSIQYLLSFWVIPRPERIPFARLSFRERSWTPKWRLKQSLADFVCRLEISDSLTRTSRSTHNTWFYISLNPVSAARRIVESGSVFVFSSAAKKEENCFQTMWTDRGRRWNEETIQPPTPPPSCPSIKGSLPHLNNTHTC